MDGFTTLRRLRAWLGICALALALGMGGGGYASAETEAETIAPQLAQQTDDNRRSSDERRDLRRQLRLFETILRHVHEGYVDEVQYSDLIAGAIDGMLDTLDPHSSYLSSEDFAAMLARTSGEFGGLGIQIDMEDGLVRVVAPIDDTPAARAGIQPGDLIIRIDDEDVFGLSLREAVERMRGDIGTDIAITIRRGETDPFDLVLTRGVIPEISVSHESYGGVGHIRISNFNEQTTPGLDKAIAELKSVHGNGLVGVVLDLRNNPGGLLSEAISVSDAFLESGVIVSTRGRNGRDASSFSARRGDALRGLPMVVLINRGSASASEIVAGALRDNDRALLMGERSFGKGSVQSILPLPGEDSGIRLTTARYYTPSGERIQATGIEPDITVAPAIVEAIDAEAVREENLRGALDNLDADTTTTAPVSTEIADYQLARAIDLLRGIDAFKQAIN